MKPKHTTHHTPAKTHHNPAAHSTHPHGSAPHTAHPATPADPADSAAQQNALKSFLQPAISDPTRTDDTREPAESLPSSRNQHSAISNPHSPPWSADLADQLKVALSEVEGRHHAALTQLATQHQTALAALESRLAATEHTTANLSGQLRELR